MKIHIRSFVLGLSLITQLISKAQEFSLDAEFRINPVYSLGFRKPMYSGDKAGLYTMQRTRLITTYKKENDLEVEVIVQDRRFWGDQSDRDDVPNMALYRGWIEKQFKYGFSLRLGRQGLVYDEQYLLGDPNWVGTRAHDAGLLKFEKETFKAHLGFAYNANGQELTQEVYKYNEYKNMVFLWTHKDFKKAKVSMIAINRGMQAKDTMNIFYMQTFGPDLSVQISNKLLFKGLFYYQIGKTTSDRNVNAFFYSAQLHYNASKKINFILGTDVGSGTDESILANKDSKVYKTFDRHYGLIHGHFGYLDYFYVNNPTLCGIEDYYLKSKFNLNSKISIEDHVHYFNTQAKINDPLVTNGTMSKYLGTENDLLLNYKISPGFKVTFGHSIMFGTRTLDVFFGGKESKNNQVYYIVLTADINFFKHKKENTETPTTTNQ